MPELPEVQTIINDLKQEKIIGLAIQKVTVYWSRTIGKPDSTSFARSLINKVITGLERRGKYLIFHLSDQTDLVVHLRMTGRLLFSSCPIPKTPYIRLSLELDQGHHLSFHDTRKFGRWYHVSHASEMLNKLGPEPLDPAFTLSVFRSILANKKRALKPLLLDQTFLAGLGNIYVDEALWRAHLHPLRKANSLNPKEIEGLYNSIIYVLERGIANQGTTLGTGRTNYYRLAGQTGKHQTLLDVFRRTGKLCNRCGQLIERIIVAQRSSHICPFCQLK